MQHNFSLFASPSPFAPFFAFIHFASLEMCTRMINERKFRFFPRFFAPLSLASSFTHFASNWTALSWKFREWECTGRKEG